MNRLWEGKCEAVDMGAAWAKLFPHQMVHRTSNPPRPKRSRPLQHMHRYARASSWTLQHMQIFPHSSQLKTPIVIFQKQLKKPDPPPKKSTPRFSILILLSTFLMIVSKVSRGADPVSVSLRFYCKRSKSVTFFVENRRLAFFQ